MHFKVSPSAVFSILSTLLIRAISINTPTPPKWQAAHLVPFTRDLLNVIHLLVKQLSNSNDRIHQYSTLQKRNITARDSRHSQPISTSTEGGRVDKEEERKNERKKIYIFRKGGKRDCMKTIKYRRNKTMNRWRWVRKEEQKQGRGFLILGLHQVKPQTNPICTWDHNTGLETLIWHPKIGLKPQPWLEK